MRMKDKQPTVESIEQQLSTARAELADAQSKLGEAISREKELSDKRAPLLRDAKLRNDQKARDALDRLTAQRSSALQEIDDFKSTIDAIGNDILDLECLSMSLAIP
jgi:DNA repair exonuclease SbcCD ATPase subunit